MLQNTKRPQDIPLVEGTSSQGQDKYNKRMYCNTWGTNKKTAAKKVSAAVSNSVLFQPLQCVQRSLSIINLLGGGVM